jgi:hypothetical protein
LAADVVFRRRALRVNSAIYARRCGPRLPPVLAGAGAMRARHLAMVAWLESGRNRRPEDARRVVGLAADIARLGRLRPGVAEDCEWHAARLRELVRQHAVVAQLEAEQRPGPAWPAARERSVAKARRGAPSRAKPRRLHA